MCQSPCNDPKYTKNMSSYASEFLTVALAHALAVASPGPDFALILRQSVRHGRKTAVLGSWGIATGILVHVTWALLGVALLIRNTPLLFQWLQYLAAAWLAWMGIQSLRSRPAAKPDTEQPPAAAHAWLAGFLTNVLNAKATLFFLALFTVVISPKTPTWLQVGYGLWMSLATGLWFTIVALLFTRPRWQARYRQWEHWIERGMGLVLLFLAAGILLPAQGLQA